MIEDFLSGYPELTRVTYRQCLADFADKIQVDPALARQEHVAVYRRLLADQSSATVHKKLSALRSWFKYLNLRGIRTDNPMLAERMPHVDALRNVRFLTEDQISMLMDEPYPDRERAMLFLFLHGLRLAELVRLNAEDYSDGTLKVTGKGEKTRYIPLSSECQSAIETYLGRRRTGPMFLSVYKHGDRIERRRVQDLVYEATDRIGCRVSPHALRHSYVTLAGRKGISVSKIQQVVGHASLSTTQRYMHLNTEDLKEAVDIIPSGTAARPALRVMNGGLA